MNPELIYGCMGIIVQINYSLNVANIKESVPTSNNSPQQHPMVTWGEWFHSKMAVAGHKYALTSWLVASGDVAGEERSY